MNHRFVFDTNIFLSALFRDSVPRKAIEAGKRTGKIYLSRDIENEIIRKYKNEKFDKYVKLPERFELLKAFLYNSENIEHAIKVNDCRDAADNKFLELAIAISADCIITGDKDLLILNPYQGIPIVTANDFLGEEWRR